MTASPPPSGLQAPPDGAAMHLYLCAPAPDTRDRVLKALQDVMGLPETLASELVDRCPSWLAGFRSADKASEIQGSLERRGVTVALSRHRLSRVETAVQASSKGFTAWLTPDG